MDDDQSTRSSSSSPFFIQLIKINIDSICLPSPHFPYFFFIIIIVCTTKKERRKKKTAEYHAAAREECKRRDKATPIHQCTGGLEESMDVISKLLPPIKELLYKRV